MTSAYLDFLDVSMSLRYKVNIVLQQPTDTAAVQMHTIHFLREKNIHINDIFKL